MIAAPHATDARSMAKILVLNGPNLNLLGQREPAVYGAATLADVEVLCREAAARLGHDVECLQSNHEGMLIDALQAAGRRVKAGELLGVVFNPGAFTHTSVALHDAIKGAEVPVVEIHISNVHAREAFRHHSYVSPAAAGIVVGFGVDGYRLAIEGLVRKTAG
jgi:3-dehydroquinate dehydratase-2